MSAISLHQPSARPACASSAEHNPDFSLQSSGSNQQNNLPSTANKTAELYCSKCRNPIDDLPRILSPTTQSSFYDTVDPNYEHPIAVVNTPLKFAEELLKRLRDRNLLSSLLQYYLDYQASVTATLVESKGIQAWESEQYDMTPARPSRRELPFVPNRLNAEWSRDVYETDVDTPHAEHSQWNQELYNTDMRESKTEDLGVKIFPCGHIYHHHCVKDMSDCSHAPTCAKAAELFYHRILVLNFNPDLLCVFLRIRGWFPSLSAG